jgi:hypothetical protein
MEYLRTDTGKITRGCTIKELSHSSGAPSQRINGCSIMLIHKVLSTDIKPGNILLHNNEEDPWINLHNDTEAM